MTERQSVIDLAIDHWTATQIARFLKVPVGTIHRWAHEDDWRRYRLRGATVYSMQDAQHSYDTRGRRRRDTLKKQGA